MTDKKIIITSTPTGINNLYKMFILDQFINHVFHIHFCNQVKAKNTWVELKKYYTESQIQEFEIEWTRYINGEINYEEFEYFINKLKQ